MDKVSYQKKQYKWRDWPTVYSLLPGLKGKTVLDLGCGVGGQLQDFSHVGAKTIGIDQDDELLNEAKNLNLPNNILIKGSVHQLNNLAIPKVDFIWASFVPAYFPDFIPVLNDWVAHLNPGGHIALIEAHEMFKHAPMDERAQKLIENYYDHAFKSGWYDFRMGRKLKGYLESAGLEIILAQTLNDKEICFKGPAASGVLDLWKARLNKMNALQEFCGDGFAQWRMRLFASFIDEAHKSLGEVHFVLARKPLKEGLKILHNAGQ